MRNYLVIALMAISVPAHAITGNDLHDACFNTSTRTYADSWVIGAMDGLTGYNIHTCIPDGVLYKQVADVVCTALDQYPEIRHYNAGLLLRASVEKAWPCSSTAR